MANAYTDRLREKYDGIKTTVEGIQTRAANEDRDLTGDELRSISEQSEVLKTLAGEIETLHEIDARNAKVAETATEVRTASTTAVDRDPGTYVRGGEHSFFGDLVNSRSRGDRNAEDRLQVHNRALTTSPAGAGVVAPRWLTEEFETLARQGRRAASAVRNLPINSAQSLTLPKQTAATDDVVKAQASEGAATDFSDEWASSTANVTPKLTAGGQIVTRQMLDSSSPAVDLLIYGDLVGAYNAKVEAAVVAAMVASAGASIGDVAAADLADGVLDAALAVRIARKLPADLAVMDVETYGELLKLKDGANRPLMPRSNHGPMNVVGVGGVETDGEVHGLGVIASDGVTGGQILAVRASDVLLFESPVTQFSYEQPLGPEQIKLGIWGYTATFVKYAGASVKQFGIDAG
ncbi:hypothetical protein AD006_01170 [Pseudonocardia sp. EC080610-09]|uniref:phage major capsid protein n=1 Tax=unclassified Pseudonocardia TaxID=2619320 RepID=UPI0007060E4E|nr:MULTISPECIES: phage major capsid protein [unclassified Pseudonocardia]ALL74277.1 hypothetical protein AD006_01170 [Pseudonocardia sp. EC080610-09]ALL81300.1 hypothetical protein AD017_08995 [Pseudonocardia sp. EC080619-01]